MEKHIFLTFLALCRLLIYFTFRKFMLFFQINKKAGISNVDRLADCISTAFLYTPAKGGTVGDPKLELEVLTLNINEGHNKELMEQCQTLKEYAQYVNYVRRYAKDFELNEAVKLAVNECIHDNILSDFLRVNKAEVISMSIFEYDKELEERKLRKAEYEAGVADGIKTATENIKREDALSLVDLGLSVEQIATALKIDLKTIQKWIEQNSQS